MCENRWDDFDDKELALIVEGLREVGGEDCDLENEAINESLRRDRERVATTCQGPGFYTDGANGTTIRVVGRVFIDHTPYVLVGESMEDPDLWSFPADRLEQRNEKGLRRFTYSRFR